MIKVNVPVGVDQVRLDQFLSTLEEPEISRSYASKLIKDDRIQLNGKSCKASSRVKEGDELLIDMPEPVSLDVVAEDIPLDIVYEDEDFLIVNKPKGMVVHPAAGHYQGTLVNAVMNHCGEELSTINGVMRPRTVNRLD